MHLLVLIMLLQALNACCITNDSKTTFTCDGGMKVNRTSLCDGITDCDDGTDELYAGKGFRCHMNGNRRKCVIPQSVVGDGVTDCDDELDQCFDANHKFLPQSCFKCLTGDQIISISQVCNGIVNCDDLSDECLCMENKNTPSQHTGYDVPNPICRQVCTASPESFPVASALKCGSCQLGDIVCTSSNKQVDILNTTYSELDMRKCLPPEAVCNGVRDCENGEDEWYCPISDFKCKDSNQTSTACDEEVTCSDMSDECSANCWNRPKYCDNVTNSEFQCNVKGNATKTLSYDQICDNVIDCDLSSADEAHCTAASHFYCWSGEILFANQSQRFDGTRHCRDGSDECTSLFHHNLTTAHANKDELVRNPFLQMCVWFMAFFALVGNTYVIVNTSRDLWNDRNRDMLGRLAKCNRTFVLNLAFADLLMGIYLLSLGIENILKSNKYCISDRAWRTSRSCTSLGIISLFSSQTSVFLLLLMTSYRLYGTLHPFKVEESRLLRGAATLTFCSWLTSAFICLIPQFRSLCDYFVDSYWLPLPFLYHDILRRPEMTNLTLNVFSMLHRSNDSAPLPNLGWFSMIKYYREINIHPIQPQWNPYVVPIGFYNLNAVCQAFFYPKIGDTSWVYMTCIIAFNFLAFVYIAVAYVVIYRISSRPNVRKSVRKRSKQWRKDNRKMQRKVLALVITDMACWLPICMIFCLKLAGVAIHPMVHGITSTFLLPINSAVNPLIYSSILDKLQVIIKEQRRKWSKSRNSMGMPGYMQQRSSSNHSIATLDTQVSNFSTTYKKLQGRAPGKKNNARTRVRFAENDSSSEMNEDSEMSSPFGDHVTSGAFEMALLPSAALLDIASMKESVL